MQLVQSLRRLTPYIYIDELETKFLQSQTLQTLVWFRHIDATFFTWIHGKDKLACLEELNSSDNNIKLSHESSKCEGSRCQVCLNVSEMETFTSTVTIHLINLTIALTVMTNA